MGKITIIYDDGDIATATATSLPLETLQKAVDGYIESVPGFRKYEGEKCVAFCDGEGKLKGKPFNLAATQLWYEQVPGAIGVDKLVGAVLIVQGADLLGKL